MKIRDERSESRILNLPIIFQRFINHYSKRFQKQAFVQYPLGIISFRGSGLDNLPSAIENMGSTFENLPSAIDRLKTIGAYH